MNDEAINAVKELDFSIYEEVPFLTRCVNEVERTTEKVAQLYTLAKVFLVEEKPQPSKNKNSVEYAEELAEFESEIAKYKEKIKEARADQAHARNVLEQAIDRYKEAYLIVLSAYHELLNERVDIVTQD